MDRGDKIFLGAVAGVVVGAGVATTRRLRRSSQAGLAQIDPELAAERERNQPHFLDLPCEQCGVNAGFRRREGTRVEPRVVHGGRLSGPVLQDQKVFFTYHACRNCGAAAAT
jgi:hypothetical protein